MTRFTLKNSDEHCIELSENPKRFDADSPVTNLFFDESNGQVFTVRSGGVTGVSVIGMDDSKSTSFRMEDKGPIVSIKFSPDLNILAIQRNLDNKTATVEFQNFKDSEPTNIEYHHTCKWKNAKILGFVWSKNNEIAFVTDHGIELLQVLSEKKQLKSLKNTSFSGAWFSWCSQSKIVLLAGNNGALIQPFSLTGSTITKLTKLEVDTSRSVVERDVFVLRLCESTWCAVFRHSTGGTVAGPTEVLLMAITSCSSTHNTHTLKTGLVGRFAVNVVDDLIVVHHQSSQTSLVFDIMEDCKVENGAAVHIPVVTGNSMKQAYLGDQFCPMYSGNWAVFQPDYMIDARLGCLWRVKLIHTGLAHSIPKEEIAKIVAVLLRRRDAKATVYAVLNQLVEEAGTYLVELSQAFDEVNSVYRRWADVEMSRRTAGSPPCPPSPASPLTQGDMAAHVLGPHAEHPLIVQVVTAYLSSLSRVDILVQHQVAELCVRTFITKRAGTRLRAMIRRGCLSDSRPLSCQLLSLGHLDAAAAQLALDMMWRLGATEEILEVLLGCGQAVAAGGVAMATGAWRHLTARKVLAAAPHPAHFAALYRALRERNATSRGDPAFLQVEQCDVFVERYKQLMAELEQR